MENFKKVVNPCQCMVWNWRGIGQHLAQAFAEIEYKDRELTVHGVIGPRPSGNCDGSCGQCVDEIREGTPNGDWTVEMLKRFCEIWDEWHLSHARAYCQHQKALGWDKLAGKRVTLYNYHLRAEVFSEQRHLQNRINKLIGKTGTATLTKEEKELWNLPISKKTWEPLDDKRYEPQKKYNWNNGATEESTLGWLNPEEHPDGILSKPCPVCGYKYGTSWLKEDVPEDVLQFLYNLPDTTREPAWV